MALSRSLLSLGRVFLMHAFANESIQPEQWMNWYAPNGVINTSGSVLHIDVLRLAFMVSLSAPVVGIFLLNYTDYTSKCEWVHNRVSLVCKKPWQKNSYRGTTHQRRSFRGLGTYTQYVVPSLGACYCSFCAYIAFNGQ